jgi:hypothetical protein
MADILEAIPFANNYWHRALDLLEIGHELCGSRDPGDQAESLRLSHLIRSIDGFLKPLYFEPKPMSPFPWAPST